MIYTTPQAQYASRLDLHPAQRQAHITPVSQTLHLACAVSNPQRYASRYRNYQVFEKHMQESNVNLITVELALRDRHHEITNAQNPNHIQLRASSELWHKENLLKIGIRRFPPDWAYGGYIDADFLMTRSDWAVEAIQQLQHHEWVQLFGTYSDLMPDHTVGEMNTGFARGLRESQSRHTEISDGYYDQKFPSFAPGGGWAFRREAYDTVGGLLDTCILGGADWHMSVSLAGLKNRHTEMQLGSPDYIESINIWARRARAIRGNIGYVSNHALHMWHGDKKQRGYITRRQLLKTHEFSPYHDIHTDWQGVYLWSGEKPRLESDVRLYFQSRNEDSI